MPIIRTWCQPIAQWHMRTPIAVGVLVLVAVVAVGTGICYMNGSFATSYLQSTKSGWSAFARLIAPGGILAVGIEFGNASSTGTIIMRPVSFPLGLRAHVHVVVQVLLLVGLGEALGWPPGRADNPPDAFPFYPCQFTAISWGPRRRRSLGLA